MTPVLFIHALLLRTVLHDNLNLIAEARRLVEGVGAGTPVCEEQAKTNGLEDAGKSTNSDGINGTLLGDDLCDELVMLVVVQ
jgi:hypothetical protein